MPRNEPDLNPILSHADELVDKLRDMLPKAIKEWDAAAIHQSRVTTRRLKAAMDVFEPISTKSHRRDLNKILRKLRKHLGPSRDLDVMLVHLQEMKSKRLEPGVAWLVKQLNQQQLELRETETQKFDITDALARLGAWWGVRQDWSEATDGLDCLISESLHLQLDRFAEQANLVAAKTIDPHQVRIAGKALRYTLEMAVAGGHRLPAGLGRAFKRMQDALGLWHDYVVLADCILSLSLASMLGYREPLLQAMVLDIAKIMVGRSGVQLLNFNKLWETKGEMLAASIRQSFPLTFAITESKTDLDPPGLKQSADNAEVILPGEPST